MQRLESHLNAINSVIQIHNKKLGDTTKKQTHLKHQFKDVFYNNKEIKDLSIKIKIKEGAQVIQQIGRLIPIHLQKQVVKGIKRLTEYGYLERATEIEKVVL